MDIEQDGRPHPQSMAGKAGETKFGKVKKTGDSRGEGSLCGGGGSGQREKYRQDEGGIWEGEKADIGHLEGVLNVHQRSQLQESERLMSLQQDLKKDKKLREGEREVEVRESQAVRGKDSRGKGIVVPKYAH